jgi:hypothetical protein
MRFIAGIGAVLLVLLLSAQGAYAGCSDDAMLTDLSRCIDAGCIWSEESYSCVDVSPPIDCVLSDWAAQPCRDDCGGTYNSGYSVRYVITEPQNGGKACGPLGQSYAACRVNGPRTHARLHAEAARWFEHAKPWRKPQMTASRVDHQVKPSRAILSLVSSTACKAIGLTAHARLHVEAAR